MIATLFGRKLIMPTLVVALAAAVMIGLGLWQLRRAEWKEDLLARYRTAASLPPIAWPAAPAGGDLPLFRRATGTCLEVVGRRAIAGESADGEPGFAHIAECRTGAEGPGMAVVIGWSKAPDAGAGWRGGPVSGIIAPDRKALMRLVATVPVAGLAAVAPPSLDAIPNNHRGYALQWFLFAAAAVVIYLLAVRQRVKRP